MSARNQLRSGIDLVSISGMVRRGALVRYIIRWTVADTANTQKAAKSQ
jgi:hypothetical protein